MKRESETCSLALGMRGERDMLAALERESETCSLALERESETCSLALA